MVMVKNLLKIIRPYALELIQEIELYTFSKAFDEGNFVQSYIM